MNLRDSLDLSGLPRRGEDGGKGKIKTNTRLGQIPGKSTEQSKHSAGARTIPTTIGDRPRRANARKTPPSHTSDHYLITPKGASDLVQVQTTSAMRYFSECNFAHEFILEQDQHKARLERKTRPPATFLRIPLQSSTSKTQPRPQQLGKTISKMVKRTLNQQKELIKQQKQTNHKQIRHPGSPLLVSNTKPILQ